MSESDLNGLKVNQERLMDDIHYSCQWGKGERWGEYVSNPIQYVCTVRMLIKILYSHPTETGMERLALSDTDKQARDWLAESVKKLGCELTIDSMGNMFAVRPGLREGPPTYAGSHLDTQPTGGRYDGILGVTAALEMLKTLKDNWVETEFPIGVVNWTK